MRRFDNKSNFDPGRFRTSITFFAETDVVKESGGTIRAQVEVKTVKAVDLQIKGNDQLAISAGATVVNDDRYFVIRKDFKPTYDMVVKHGDRHYTLSVIQPLDVPVNYYRLLCIRKHDQDTWQG